MIHTYTVNKKFIDCLYQCRNANKNKTAYVSKYSYIGLWSLHGSLKFHLDNSNILDTKNYNGSFQFKMISANINNTATEKIDLKKCGDIMRPGYNYGVVRLYNIDTMETSLLIIKYFMSTNKSMYQTFDRIVESIRNSGYVEIYLFKNICKIDTKCGNLKKILKSKI